MKDVSVYLDNLPASLQHDIVNFLVFCIELKSVLDQENSILLEKGTIKFNTLMVHKLELIDKFEPAIQLVFDKIKETQATNAGLQGYLIEVIQDLRRSLCINTTFHLNDLHKRTARIARLRDGLINFVDVNAEEAVVCH